MSAGWEGRKGVNLFALELGALLEQHGQTLTVLYTILAPDGHPAISPVKVARLQRSLTEDIPAVLSAPELTTLAAELGFAPEEEQRIRAALLGEAVHRLLMGRVSKLTALEEGERILELVLAESEDDETLREALLRGARRVEGEPRPPAADVNAAVSAALEPSAQAYAEGELWLNVALDTPDTDLQEDLLGLAWTALNRSAQLLATAPPVAQGTPQQSEWRGNVEQALAILRQIRPQF